MYVATADFDLLGVRFFDCSATSAGAALFSNSDDTFIRGCLFRVNEAPSGGGGKSQ